MGGSAARAMATMMACGLLAACQGFVPQNDDPGIPAVIAPQVDRGGPSGQRLGRDGYPMLGAYPRAATSQADPATVAQTQARYANVAERARPLAAIVPPAGTVPAAERSAAAQARSAQYGRTVDELQELARRQQERVRGQ